jgi:hypothetical protein
MIGGLNSFGSEILQIFLPKLWAKKMLSSKAFLGGWFFFAGKKSLGLIEMEFWQSFSF